MLRLSDDKQAHSIEAFNSTSSYLDDIQNINNIHLYNMVRQIYPSDCSNLTKRKPWITKPRF